MRQWYAMRSKPKKELSAIAMLARADIETYFPTIASKRFPGRSTETVPFFPSYFFAHLDAEIGEFQLARYTQGVLHLVGYGGEPCPVPDQLIELIKERVTGLQGRGIQVDLSRGDRVVITNGPLQGTEAIFDRHLSATGRAHVLVQMLHRLCATDVYVGQLKLLKRAAGIA